MVLFFVLMEWCLLHVRSFLNFDFGNYFDSYLIDFDSFRALASISLVVVASLLIGWISILVLAISLVIVSWIVIPICLIFPIWIPW